MLHVGDEVDCTLLKLGLGRSSRHLLTLRLRVLGILMRLVYVRTLAQSHSVVRVEFVQVVHAEARVESRFRAQTGKSRL